MVCTICGKHSHFCIGRAQSIHCAMMQHMVAVGHRNVCPTLTNTRLLNPPIEHNVGYPVRRVTKKVVFLPAEPTIGGGCLLSFRLSLCYCLCTRVPSKATFSDTPVFCRTPFWPPNCCSLVTVLLQSNVELHFDLSFTAVFKWWLAGVAKLGKHMIDALAGKCVIVAGCARLCAFLLVSSGHQWHLSCTCRWSLRWDIARHHESMYPTSTTIISDCCGTTFVSAMLDSHQSVSRCVSLVARGCSQIRSITHECTSRLTSGLTEKTKLNVW